MAIGAAGRGWRSRKEALAPLAVSLLVHLLLAWTVVGGWVPVGAASEDRPSPRLRFELVDTPASAEVEEPPEDPRNSSSRTTRSQAPESRSAEEPSNDRPRILEHGETRDLRPIAQAAAPSLRPEPSSPAEASAPSEAAPASRQQETPTPAPAEEGVVTLERAREREAAVSSPPRPPSPSGGMAQPGATREGRRNPTPAERDDLGRALAEGEFSYAAAQHFFAEYLLRLRDRIDSQWTLQLMGGFLTPGEREVVVDFLVEPAGTITDLKVRKLQGDADFAALCTRAIRQAAPFGPVPYEQLPGWTEELSEIPLRIRFTFSYR